MICKEFHLFYILSKVFIPPQDRKVGIVFLLKCPGQNDEFHELIMTKDGSEARNLKYQDVCPVAIKAVEPRKQEVRVAYNNDPGWFNVFSEANTMEEYSLLWTLYRSKQHPYVSKDWEMLKIFFDNNNIEPIWINCNFTWGWFDEESNSWTGGAGQVIYKLSLRLILTEIVYLSRLRVAMQTWQYLAMAVHFREWQ